MTDDANHLPRVSDLGRAGAAYREIKQRIIQMHYQPGEKLSEVRLAAELGCGRSPIRTALARLQGEGWIAVSPQSGTFVRGLSDREIHEILDLRLVLESHVAGLAATRIGAEELAALRQAFRAFGRDVSGERLGAYLDLDLRLHLTIYEAGGNRQIAGILTNLIDKVRWIRHGSTDSPERLREAFAEIHAILDALEARDAEAASAAMRRHIGNIAEFRRDRRRAMPGQLADESAGEALRSPAADRA